MHRKEKSTIVLYYEFFIIRDNYIVIILKCQHFYEKYYKYSLFRKFHSIQGAIFTKRSLSTKYIIPQYPYFVKYFLKIFLTNLTQNICLYYFLGEHLFYKYFNCEHLFVKANICLISISNNNNSIILLPKIFLNIIYISFITYYLKMS